MYHGDLHKLNEFLIYFRFVSCKFPEDDPERKPDSVNLEPVVAQL